MNLRIVRDLGGVPPQGSPLSFRDESSEGHHMEVVITDFEGGDGSNGDRGGGCIDNYPPEHNIPVNCDPTNTVSVYGSGEEARSTFEAAVVITGGS